MLTAFLICSEDEVAICGGDVEFRTPEDTYNSITEIIYKNAKYGAYRLDIKEGYVYYKEQEQEHEKKVSEFGEKYKIIVFSIEGNIEDDFYIDPMGIDPKADINEIYNNKHKTTTAKKMVYKDFMNSISNTPV